MSLTFRTIHPPPREESAISQDLSAGGVLFNTPAPLAAGALLDVEVILPFDSLPLQASGRVAWVREKLLPGGVPQYETGVEFVQMSPADRARLGQYLQQPRNAPGTGGQAS